MQNLIGQMILPDFSVAFLSFCFHFLLYGIIRSLIPILLKNSNKYKNLKEYDRWHLPQVIVSLIHAIISTQGSIR